MAKRRTAIHARRTLRRAERRSAKEHAMEHPGGQSNYARKRKWLHKNDRSGYEAEVLAMHPKPWHE
jgi:hypothetical protein